MQDYYVKDKKCISLRPDMRRRLAATELSGPGVAKCGQNPPHCTKLDKNQGDRRARRTRTRGRLPSLAIFPTQNESPGTPSAFGQGSAQG